MKGKSLIFWAVALLLGLFMVSSALAVPVTTTEPSSDICGTYTFTATTEALGFEQCVLASDSIGTTAISNVTNTSALQTSWSLSFATASYPEVSYQLNITCYALNATIESWQDSANDTTVDRTAPVLTYTINNPSDGASDSDSSWTAEVTSDEIAFNPYFVRKGIIGSTDYSASLSNGDLTVSYAVTPEIVPYGDYDYYIKAYDNATDSSGVHCNLGTSTQRAIHTSISHSKTGIAVGLALGIITKEDLGIKDENTPPAWGQNKSLKYVGYGIIGLIAIWVATLFPPIVYAYIVIIAIWLLMKLF